MNACSPKFNSYVYTKHRVLLDATVRLMALECHERPFLHSGFRPIVHHASEEIRAEWQSVQVSQIPTLCANFCVIICDVYPCQHQRFVNQIVGMRDAHAGLARALVRTFHSSD